MPVISNGPIFIFYVLKQEIVSNGPGSPLMVATISLNGPVRFRDKMPKASNGLAVY